MPNTGGPRQQRRLLLTNVVRSISLYAPPIWLKGAESGTFMRQMNSVHRICALRICCAFRTVSGEAAMVLAGTAPFDLQAAVIDLASSRSGSQGYLHRFGHASDPYCSHCETQVMEDAEHVFMHGGRFAGAREELEVRLEGRVETESVVEHMISSKEKWVAVNTVTNTSWASSYNKTTR
ncbi:uncharacterized protein LOC127565083 [Drosophila albomicans]|uniref:Uncharacterized protein LOC127565083 n=1 Tax=Drosophila albomicans TaxID=7291 RepID=A0A9C6WCF7_DROAB|nr:uncharacterized protein LOC127565083 [Drosophila albomicans]